MDEYSFQVNKREAPPPPLWRRLLDGPREFIAELDKTKAIVIGVSLLGILAYVTHEFGDPGGRIVTVNTGDGKTREGSLLASGAGLRLQNIVLKLMGKPPKKAPGAAPSGAAGGAPAFGDTNAMMAELMAAAGPRPGSPGADLSGLAKEFARKRESASAVSAAPAKAENHMMPIGGHQGLIEQEESPRPPPKGDRDFRAAPQEQPNRERRFASLQAGVSHVFSRMPVGQRNLIIGRMENGERLVEACKNSGLASECLGVAQECQADPSCQPSLARLAGENVGVHQGTGNFEGSPTAMAARPAAPSGGGPGPMRTSFRREDSGDTGGTGGSTTEESTAGASAGTTSTAGTSSTTGGTDGGTDLPGTTGTSGGTTGGSSGGGGGGSTCIQEEPGGDCRPALQ